MLFFQSCVAHARYFENDPPLKEAAMQLASDYPNDQLTRTYGTYDVKEQYGEGAVTIDLLRGYNILGTGYDAVGAPAVFCSVRTGSKDVGFFHRHFTLILSYSPELRSAGDKYLGLRILEIRESRKPGSPVVQK